jgi:hypothetical protein
VLLKNKFISALFNKIFRLFKIVFDDLMKQTPSGILQLTAFFWSVEISGVRAAICPGGRS